MENYKDINNQTKLLDTWALIYFQSKVQIVYTCTTALY